ncbi:MAG: HU family DNA-binding protein [Planctomycetota bacterium]|jgi:DNA-binding protein HU-beta|nr:HU family DNA-binding protein [Planctomycetota bacterium]
MAAKIEVMRKRQLAQALVDKTGSKLKYAAAVVDFIFDEIAGAVCKGTKVNVKDFGIFVKAQRKARVGRNPATGEPIKIKASVKPRFSASKALKEAVGGKKYAAHADIGALAAVIDRKIPAAPKPAAKKAPAAKKPAAKKAPAKKAAKRR